MTGTEQMMISPGDLDALDQLGEKFSMLAPDGFEGLKLSEKFIAGIKHAYEVGYHPDRIAKLARDGVKAAGFKPPTGEQIAQLLGIKYAKAGKKPAAVPASEPVKAAVPTASPEPVRTVQTAPAPAPEPPRSSPPPAPPATSQQPPRPPQQQPQR